MNRTNYSLGLVLGLLAGAGCEPFQFVSMGDASGVGGRSGQTTAGTSAIVPSAGAGGSAGSMSFGGFAGIAGAAASAGIAGAAGSGPAICPTSACAPLSVLTLDVPDKWLSGRWFLNVCFNTDCLQAEVTIPEGNAGAPQLVTQPPREPDGFRTTTAITRKGNGTRLDIEIYLTQNESRSRLQDGDRFTATLGTSLDTPQYHVEQSASYSVRRPECTNCLTATLSDVPPTLIRRRVTQIAATLSHACAIADNKVFCWGNGFWGVLGNGTTTESPIPVEVTGVPGNPLAIALGTDHSCAATDVGVYCWGHIDESAVLVPQRSGPPDPYVPTKVIAAVFGATCANVQGRVACFGTAPGFQPNNLNITPIALAGMYGHFCAISAEGGVWCWGEGDSGELGVPTPNSAAPSVVPGLDANVTFVSAGRRQSCAIKNGEAYCWGSNKNGVLGDGTVIMRYTPVKVVGLPGQVDRISTGLDSTCAIVSGAIYCWGDNARGQLGNGTENGSYTPVAIPGLASGAQEVSVGYRFACAIVEGRAYCWGANDNYTMGSTAEMSDCSDVPCSLSPREVLFP